MYKLKRHISIFLVIALVFSVAAFSSVSTASAAEGGFEYAVDEDGYASVTGYTGNGTNLEIPSEYDGHAVRYIDEFAFLQNTTVTSVKIPSTIREIGRYAFFACEKLESVSFADGVRYIGKAAFGGTALRNVVLPDSLCYIDDYAFYDCASMTSATLGKRVSYIGEHAVGMTEETHYNGFDNETRWNLYDKMNVSTKDFTLSGYNGTPASDYADSEKITYTNLGNAEVSEIGDVNGDGTINVKDATVVQKIASEIISADKYDTFVADVNDDGSINGEDTTAIMKSILGFDVSFGGSAYEAPYSGDDVEMYELPTLRFEDINEDKKSNNTIAQVIAWNSKDNASTAKVTLENMPGLDEESVESYVNVKLQGSSSMGYAKKNFTIKLVKDAQETQKNKMEIVSGWGAESKYCLKANYIDHSHARNVVSAKLWGDIVRSRDSADETIKNLVNGGAIDGFPIKVYINGDYQGLYTFNIPKDGWMLGMDSETVNQAILCGEQHSGSSAFLAPYNNSDWSLEYATNEDDVAWIESSFNRFYYFLRDSSDAEFKEHISEYTDLNACIDYMIFIQAVCGMDCLDKNMLLVTFDGGEHWFPSAYDLDTTFGIHWNGQSFYEDNTMASVESLNSRSPSLLWKRLRAVFPDEVNERYAQLREGPLSLENIITRFDDFCSQIPNGLYDIDVNGVNPAGSYYSVPQSDRSNVNQIVTYAEKHLKYVDAAYQ